MIEALWNVGSILEDDLLSYQNWLWQKLQTTSLFMEIISVSVMGNNTQKEVVVS